MYIRRTASCAGFTLLEILIASGIMLIVSVGLYRSAIFVRKLVRHNATLAGARALMTQKLEEITAVGYSGIMMQRPYEIETFLLEDRHQLTRQAVVVEHGTGSNMYLEVSVGIRFYSPFKGCNITNSYSTLVFQ